MLHIQQKQQQQHQQQWYNISKLFGIFETAVKIVANRE